MANANIEKWLKQLQRRREIYKLEYYQPYPYQERFHNAEGHLTPGKPAVLKALVGGNQIGKSMMGCMEDAMHLTGRYPDWWKGHRFKGPIIALVAGVTNDTVRDILQSELLGDPSDPSKLGTGTIPIDAIGSITKKAGVPNAVDMVRVRYKDSQTMYSKLYFRAYEQGWKKFQGIRCELVHADEEPPEDIWDQMLRSMFSRKTAVGYITATPEDGLTKLIDGFMNDLKKGQAFINAGWKDAPHMMTEDGELTDKAKMLASSISKDKIDLRTKGLPISGTHMVYDVADEKIVVDPFPIPRHFARINGIDFGWDHPFAAAGLAYDRDNDCIYLVNEYMESKALPAIHVQAIKAWGDWIPVAWPHDGLNTEKGSGEALITQYRDLGLNALREKATNPPDVGQPEGSGGNSVEAGVMDILERMMEGRFKVFSTCNNFLREKAMYHRKNGKIVKLNDDFMDAVRYACIMVRHARTPDILRAPNVATTRSGVQYASARPQRNRA